MKIVLHVGLKGHRYIDARLMFLRQQRKKVLTATVSLTGVILLVGRSGVFEYLYMNLEISERLTLK